MICYSILIEPGIKRVRKIELSPLHNCWGCPKVQSELEVGVEAQYHFFFKCADIFSASFAILNDLQEFVNSSLLFKQLLSQCSHPSQTNFFSF